MVQKRWGFRRWSPPELTWSARVDNLLLIEQAMVSTIGGQKFPDRRAAWIGAVKPPAAQSVSSRRHGAVAPDGKLQLGIAITLYRRFCSGNRRVLVAGSVLKLFLEAMCLSQ